MLVSGLSEYNFGLDSVAEDTEKLTVLLRTAERQRHVGSTLSNDRSSRSHLLCMLTVDSWVAPASAGEVAPAGVQHCTLQLVDLAGSERRQAASEEAEAEAPRGAA